MIHITFVHPDGTAQSIGAPEHWSLMQVAVHHGVKGIEGACGGSMACATCHVCIHPDWVSRVNAENNEKTEEETDTLEMVSRLQPTSRLACQIQITKALDGLIVFLPSAL